MRDGVAPKLLKGESAADAVERLRKVVVEANAEADRKNVPGARYKVRHVWGEGVHSDEHGGVLLPEILRWMWE